MNSTPLPDFAKPPVTEVVLGMQFDALPKLRNLQICRLWSEVYRGRFPTTEEHAPLHPVVEKFGVVTPPAARIVAEFDDTPPVPRYWFINAPNGTDLVQVQQDRFVRNWRKAGTDEEYPRYESVRARFQQDARLYLDFLASNQLGELVPNQCEVTYINHIEAGAGWSDHADVGKVIQSWSGQHSDDFLPRPEDISLTDRFIIPGEDNEPAGRLSIVLQPGYRKDNDLPVFILMLTARGRPMGEGIAGVLKFFDVGREWIVRGFASITTRQMHQIWERRDVRY